MQVRVSQATKILKSQKERVTDKRELILELIFEEGKPISVQKIKDKLREKGVTANKTTIYRFVGILVENDIISEVNISPLKKHYESAFLDHHHHLVCKNCDSIEEIVCSELEEPMQELSRRALNNGFEINEHDLEFYGVCSGCK